MDRHNLNTTRAAYSDDFLLLATGRVGGFGPMSQLLPYETIVKASEATRKAVAAVLSHGIYPLLCENGRTD